MTRVKVIDSSQLMAIHSKMEVESLNYCLDNICLSNYLARHTSGKKHMADIYAPQNFDPRTSIGGLVGRTRGALFGAMDAALAQFDLTTPQYIALVLVASGAASRPGDICRMLAHDPGAMTRMIDRLEERKLVRRVSDPDDRRALNLELTAQGKALYPKLIETAVGVLNRFLHGFTKTEARQLEDMLQRMLANADTLDTP